MSISVPEARPNRIMPRTGTAASALVHLSAVVGVSVLLGAATSFAQTFLPDALRPFANSASGWTLLTAGAVAACRASSRWSAVLGAASFVALVLGYQGMSTLRGFPTSETLFLIIAVVVGPFVGVAAAWLRRSGVRAVVGCSVLAGIAIGEGAWGLIMVSATTGWFYWTLIAIAGLALLAVGATRRTCTSGARLLLIGLTALLAVSFFSTYSAISGLAF